MLKILEDSMLKFHIKESLPKWFSTKKSSVKNPDLKCSQINKRVAPYSCDSLVTLREFTIVIAKVYTVQWTSTIEGIEDDKSNKLKHP